MNQVVIPLSVKIHMDKASKDAPYVAYSPEVDVASCGPTENKARQNLKEAIELVVEELRSQGRLSEFLEETGFQKENKHWVAPKISFEPFVLPL